MQDYSQKKPHSFFSDDHFVQCNRKGLKRYMSDYKWKSSDESICGDTGAKYFATYSSTKTLMDESGEEFFIPTSGYCCVRK